MTKKTKKIIIAAVAVVVVAGLAVGGWYLHALHQYRSTIQSIVLETPDLSRVPDGTFSGSFDAGFVSADVDVTVENHVITQVVIINHHHGSWDDAVFAEVVADRVVAQQTLHVDTVSGATNSSLVILSAIQNALESGVN
ncbi:MAG: FMN-binding protein [Defluviitaleaceae bacterium]|nr:FMN-binding protein [Defluviitaleaceae bacterium]